jgi:alpha-tubulin suppressor-like RCC1 family protein
MRDGGGDGMSALPDAGADVTPTPQACAEDSDCPARFFCGAVSKTCTSAVVQVTAGAQHTCALHDDGHVTCWGLAESILAGGPQALVPRIVADGQGARALAAGAHLTCAITAARTLRCWGNQQETILRPDGTSLADVQAVALGTDYGCATNPQGVHCWGKNDFGQLAQPLTLADSATAVLSRPAAGALSGSWIGTGIAAVSIVRQPAGAELCAWGRNATSMISAMGGLGVMTTPQCRAVADVAELGVGDTHVCVRHAAGTFTCWGERYYGQLGIGGSDGDTADVPPPGSVTSLPGSAMVVQLVLGVNHTCGLLSDGSVTCFGRNNLGQAGPGASAEEVRTPITVSGLAGKVFALGAGSTAQHTCAIVANGSVQCWGSNSAGQLGTGGGAPDPGRKSATPVTVGF